MSKKRLQTNQMEEQVASVIEYFFETYQTCGRVIIEFEHPRAITDSDMNSVINTYLYPVDDVARRSFGERYKLHLQFLGDEINPGVFGYRYEATIEADPAVDQNARICVHLDSLSGASQ